MMRVVSESFELTILMPCLNEAETLAICIDKAKGFIDKHRINAEILIADNGSIDGSVGIALGKEVRLLHVPERGYGAALKAGIEHAKGKYVIMGDADDSYDFSALEGILSELRSGGGLVMGNRFAGGIEKGAMPWLHYYLGNPVLSYIGRKFYRIDIGDFHCGLRGGDVSILRSLDLHSPGMEFASEMVVKSAINDVDIREVPVKLRKDGRTRPPHLRTWRDGWRHLKFLSMFSPRWLFLLPGILLFLLCSTLLMWLSLSPIVVFDVGLDIHTMAYMSAGACLGMQMIMFALATRHLGMLHRWLPYNEKYDSLFRFLTLEKLIFVSISLLAIGLLIAGVAIDDWAGTGFGGLNPRDTMRKVMPSVTCIMLAGQIFLTAFMIEIIKIPARRRHE